MHNGKVTEHWGPLGERGDDREHSVDPKLSGEENLLRILRPSLAKGYEPIDIDSHAALIVEYIIDGWGTDADLAKRHELENYLNDMLGWTGLGHCDGGSIGSGSMEVCCFVVDFEAAKNLIEDELNDTEFADYSRIYDGNDEV